MIKDLEDYVDMMHERYPKIPRIEIKKTLEHGFNTFAALCNKGADVTVNNWQYRAFCGRRFSDSAKRAYYQGLKRRIKLRLQYRYNQEVYSGVYYFGLTESEWDYYKEQIKSKRRSKIKFTDLLLYKIQEESFIDKSKKYFFEIYYPIDVGWVLKKSEISTRNFRYIGYRDSKDKIVLI